MNLKEARTITFSDLDLQNQDVNKGTVSSPSEASLSEPKQIETPPGQGDCDCDC